MENYYAQVSIASQTGETADAAVNVFAISHAGVLSTSDVDAWQTAIKSFYENCKVAGAMKGRAQTGHVSKFLKATASVPNYPIETRDWSFTAAPGALSLPNEVALCVSYASDSFPLVPRARRRGRIYISGWDANKNSSGRPITAAYEDLAVHYGNYCDDMYAIADIAPGVWSRITSDVFPLDRVWCDNEWDTQRRRGGKATLRKTVVL